MSESASLTRLSRIALILAAAGLLGGPVAAQQPPSEEAIKFFKTNCASCHTIGGGRLVGPDLKNVIERQERPWLTAFIQDAQGVINRGDPYAQQLVQDAKGVLMPVIPGMNPELAEKLIDLIIAESALEKSQFAGLMISDRPLTALDVERGLALFEGREPFQAGAPACISCHTAGALRGFGGGHLGPDLTSVYARMEGRKPLAAWLSAPPLPVMLPIFEDHPLEGEEVLQLVAFFKSTAEQGGDETVRASLDFLLVSFGAAALVLALFDFAWRRRFRAVRKPLVEHTES